MVVREEALAQEDRALDTRPLSKGCLGRDAAQEPNRLRTRTIGARVSYLVALGLRSQRAVQRTRSGRIFEL